MSRALKLEIWQQGARVTGSTMLKGFTVTVDSISTSHNLKPNMFHENNTNGSFVTSTKITPDSSGYYSIWTITTMLSSDKYYRIRVTYSGGLFCSSWFSMSDDGYESYLPFRSRQGNTTGLYQIYSSGGYFAGLRHISGYTQYNTGSFAGNLENFNKVPSGIPIYATTAGGSPTYPCIVASGETKSDGTYSVRVPSTVTTSGPSTYSFAVGGGVVGDGGFREHWSYSAKYGLISNTASQSISGFSSGVTYRSLDLVYSKLPNIITTGEMVKLMHFQPNKVNSSTYTQALTANALTNGLNCHLLITPSNSNQCVKFTDTYVLQPLRMHIKMLTNGTIVNVVLQLNSTSVPAFTQQPNWPASTSTKDCYEWTRIPSYNNYAWPATNQTKVYIGGYASSVGSLYWKACAYDGTVLSNTQKLTSSACDFNAPFHQLDGATVYLSTSSTITNTTNPDAKRGIDSSETAVTYGTSWSGTGGGGTSSASAVALIGEWDEEGEAPIPAYTPDDTLEETNIETNPIDELFD